MIEIQALFFILPRDAPKRYGGRNPAPVDTVNIPLFTRFYTSQVVQDFFHQQYHNDTNASAISDMNYHKLPRLASTKTSEIMKEIWQDESFLHLGPDA